MTCTVDLDRELARLDASLAGPRLPRQVSRVNIDEVVADAVAGDGTATEELLAFLRPLVMRYCRGKLGRVQRTFSTADDVAQEVCVAVYRALPGYQQLGRPFLSFVYGIAAHKVADVHRANSRDKSDPIAESPEVASPDDGPEQVTLRHELAERTGALLRMLTPRQREILVLRVVMGLSAQETADIVGTTADAIRVAQHRALTRLRKTVTRP